jgi:hypothetical protein
MKKLLQPLVAILFLATIATSCKKENHHQRRDEVKNLTLNISVDAGVVYNLDLNTYGDADDIATISKQATDFTISEIVKQGIIGKYSFMRHGTPKTGGNGTDVVVLKITEPAGRCNRIEETNITINFTVL